jgi:hypothetical protein
MNNAVNIPWGAVVQGGPPSWQQQAKSLPLVLAQKFDGRSSFASVEQDCQLFIRLLTELPTDESLSVGRHSGFSTQIETLLYGDEVHAIASLTSDGESSVILQSLSSSWATYDTHDPALAIDASIHSYILRYAKIDTDLRAFVLPDSDDVAPDGCQMHFIRPQNWGFRPTTTGTFAWTVSRLEPASHSIMRNAYCSTNPVLLPPYRSPFEPPVTSDRGDPLQCVPPLKHARATLERRLCSMTNPLHAEELCYWPALALGRCRLFGVNVGDESDFTLAPEPFSHASSWLMKRLRVLIRWAENIEQLRDRGRAYVDQNLALELLEIRMDAHAAYLALDEAYAAARFVGEVEADAMGRRLHQVRRLIDRLDGNLQNQIPLLRLAAGTRLLENWRRLLAPAYRDLPPWWLNGCLGLEADALA